MRKRRERSPAGSINRLKQGAAPRSVIDPRNLPRKTRQQCATINMPRPRRMPQRVVLCGPFVFKNGLRATVMKLLPPVSPSRIAAAMPDHRRRSKADRPAVILNAPTNVNVIAGNAHLGIETADLQQCLPAECHVAARHVLCDLIRQQNMGWTAWRPCNAVGNHSAVWRSNVRSADRHMTRCLEF